jgi:hypothetical protein
LVTPVAVVAQIPSALEASTTPEDDTQDLPTSIL